jgi:hypothetical protein
VIEEPGSLLIHLARLRRRDGFTRKRIFAVESLLVPADTGENRAVACLGHGKAERDQERGDARHRGRYSM